MNKKFKKDKAKKAFNQFDPKRHPEPKVQEKSELESRPVPTHFPGELEELTRDIKPEPIVEETPVVESNEVPVEEPEVVEIPVEEPIVEVPVIESPEEVVPIDEPVEEDRSPIEIPQELH